MTQIHNEIIFDHNSIFNFSFFYFFFGYPNAETFFCLLGFLFALFCLFVFFVQFLQ